MKIIIFLSCLIAMTTACKGGASTPSKESLQQDSTPAKATVQQSVSTPVAVKTIPGYFFRNTYEVDDKGEYFAFTDRVSFNNYLGMAKTMDNNIEMPDFNKNIIAVIVLAPTNTQTEITVGNADITSDGTLNIHFEPKVGEEIPYTMQPVVVLSIAKDNKIKGVKFINNGVVAKEVTLK